LRHVVKLPRLGETVDQVVLLEWLVKVGDTVAEGDPLALVDTDKVEAEVPAPVGGVVAELLVEVEAELETGTRMCLIDAG
jgi:pyruvate/2-oxoglutarate dehydrogenase complex dihydrolipoamide acyltransferase (E2) component